MTDTTMNTGAASLSDEQIEALKTAALAATPQEIDSAQSIDHYEDGSFITCPACGGEGNVDLNSDFCNYDGEALGVQFYGIGDAHKLAEDYFRAARPATVLALIERLERAESATPTSQADAAPLPREAATVGITAARYIVIGYGETDHPQAAFVNEREHLLDAVLGMIYTHPSDACDETREEYRHDLADDDEWSHEGIWRTEFEIGGVVIYDLGAPASASNGEQ